MKATHIQYKGTSLENKVILVNFCHNPDYAIIDHIRGKKGEKVHISTLTEIVPAKGGFWAKVGKYVLDSVVPVVIGLLSRKVLRK